MGILALLTRETPAAIASERKSLRKILESSASQANAVEKRMEKYASRLESRLAQLPQELETGLDPLRIAKLLGESLRQCFQQPGLPDTARAVGQSCAENELHPNATRERAPGSGSRPASARSRAIRAQLLSNSFLEVLCFWASLFANNFVQVTLASFHKMLATLHCPFTAMRQYTARHQGRQFPLKAGRGRP
jgi:hypothetical protein